MSKEFLNTVASIFLLFFGSYLIPTEGLECYHCAFVEGNLPTSFKHKGEPSCESEKNIDPSLIVDCEHLVYIPDHEQNEKVFIGFEKENITHKQSKGKWEFFCFNQNFNGKLITGSDINFTHRSCLARPTDLGIRLPEKCYSNLNSEIGKEITEDEVKSLLSTLQPLFMNTTQAEVCICNTDNCNGYGGILGKKEKTYEANGAGNQSNLYSILVLSFLFLFKFSYLYKFC